MKNSLWKQANPHDQLTVLLMALEGNYLNAVTNVISSGLFIERCGEILSQLQELKPFLSGKEKW